MPTNQSNNSELSNSSSSPGGQHNEPLISLRGVGKILRTEELETHALSNINLDIHQGEFLSVSGPSGCGKSTLLSIIGLLDEPTSGQFKLKNITTEKLNMDQRAQLRSTEIGFIFQSFNLIGDLSVYENVELPLSYRDGIKKDEVKTKVENALDRVGMTHRKRHYPGQLSGGQQQRVAIARALVSEPSLLLADEPTGNLDSKNGEAVMNLLTELHSQGTTICMVTHDPRYADRSDRNVRIFDGRLVDENIRTESADKLIVA
ncbi:ABC transporter ATP-binding protein [Aliikangiella coralliicola]|uniref:ABC transporter ATP-binding protein n=1 Tax=Aliikangiella coralliicola TaxID=2592383 RepID=A0A545UGG5_9GAMM|nr:ABC transporter ATP-binding protein [Aliikangiella coralliicola]TQV88559.1 ABC transporter ATP-binding protein [Aliikangiella coralliicola]